MTELQEKMLLLLKEIDEICVKHDITYFLFAGTALGAARHKGFIPWDDDTDIIMDLENYEKFLKIIPDELKENRTIDWLETKPEYPLTYARYIATDTTAIQRHTAFGNCSPGVKVDIFCVVPTFSDEEKRQKHITDVLGFAEVLCNTGRMILNRPEGFYAVYQREHEEIQRMGREEYIEAKLHELMHRAEGETEKVLLFSGMMSNTKTYDADIFHRAVYVPYENISLPISAENDKFSTQHIAESWPDLPPNMEKPRHSMLLDLNRPFTDYYKIISREIDMEEAKKVCEKRKENNLLERDEYRDVLANNQKIRNLALEMDMAAAYAKADQCRGMSPAEMVAFFKPYYDMQQATGNKTYGLSVSIPREAFEKAIGSLICLGQYFKAASVLRTCTKAGYVSDDDDFVIGARRDIEISRKLAEACFRYDDAESTAKLLEEAETIRDSLVHVAAECRVEMDRPGSSMQSIIDKIDEATGQLGEAGELLLIKGLCLEKEGRKDEASEVYDLGMENVSNGFVMQRLREKGASIEKLFRTEEIREIKADRKLLRTNVYSVMTGKSTTNYMIFSDLVTQKGFMKEVKKLGLNKGEAARRYSQHRTWSRRNKKDIDAEFEEYSNKLFGIKAE